MPIKTLSRVFLVVLDVCGCLDQVFSLYINQLNSWQREWNTFCDHFFENILKFCKLNTGNSETLPCDLFFENILKSINQAMETVIHFLVTFFWDCSKILYINNFFRHRYTPLVEVNQAKVAWSFRQIQLKWVWHLLWLVTIVSALDLPIWYWIGH